MFSCFSHPMIYVADLQRAVDFYQGILGFTIRYLVPGQFASLWHEGMACRVDLHPSEADGADVGHGPLPYFQVTDLDASLAALAAKGVRVSEPMQEGQSPRFASFWDSEGNALGLEERIDGI